MGHLYRNFSGLLCVFVLNATATTYFVDASGTNATPPYNNWTTAATNIQDAVDAASTGDTVLVTNGVYATGGRVAPFSLQTNRVVVDKPLKLLSVNGPAVTMIRGSSGPYGILSTAGIRGIYLTNNALLSGFNISGGASSGGGIPNAAGGGIFCTANTVIITNCIISTNWAASYGGGGYQGTYYNCTFITNASLMEGGAAFDAILINCNFRSNYANYGGAIAGDLFAPNPVRCLATNCTFIGNYAKIQGGAAYGKYGTNCVLDGCTLSNNISFGPVGVGGPLGGGGGGGYGSIILNSLFVNNIAAASGGGALTCNITNCTMTGNIATNGGGGAASQCNLMGCLVSNNIAGGGGGGVEGGRFLVINSLIVSNYTFYAGGGANDVTLIGCTIIKNIAGTTGGGADASTLSSCVVSNNTSLANQGGGVAYSTATNCLIIKNTGGGAFTSGGFGCTINGNTSTTSGGGVQDGGNGYGYFNCLVISNRVTGAGGIGGGASDGKFYNCTFAYNTAAIGPGSSNSTLVNCILYQNLPVGGVFSNSTVWPMIAGLSAGSLTNDPALVNPAAGNFRLQSNSPCINSGLNTYVKGSDLDGNPRIQGGTVDMGAYEYQTPTSIISYAWLQQFGFPIDGTADFVDPDGDGMNNWQEWKAWTDPMDGQSNLRMVRAVPGTNGVIATWLSASNVNYFLQRRVDLAVPGYVTVKSNIFGAVGAVSTDFLDTNAVGSGQNFYRVGVP